MNITPLGKHIGAEVTDLDLGATVSADDTKRLNQAITDHLVLVIRDQALSPQQYRDGLRVFGEPMLQHRAQFNLEDCPEVSQVVSRGGFPPAVRWHTDHTNHPLPPKFTALYGREIPATGGDTAFANMYAALERLPESEQRELMTRFTLNSMEDNPSYSASDRDTYPGSVRHPMVRLHPESGRSALYFHVSKSQGIEGMDEGDVRPYLESLLERTIDDTIVYRHRWQAGDIVICDNRCTMHRVYADYAPEDYRLLWRLLIRGEKPHGVNIN